MSRIARPVLRSPVQVSEVRPRPESFYRSGWVQGASGSSGKELLRDAGRAEEIGMTRRAALTVLGAGVISRAKATGASPIIRTVLKDLAPESLSGGATLFHEHLSLAPDFMPRWIALARGQNTQSKAAPAPSSPAQPSDRPFFMQDAELMADELRAAAKEGVACIVDGGHPDMGRDLDFLKKISMQSGMPIVAGCGYYSQPFYPPEIASMTEDQITRELVRQARTQAVGAFGEIGSWDEITDLERRVFRAVGKAHLETNRRYSRI